MFDPEFNIIKKIKTRYGIPILATVFIAFAVCLCFSPKRSETATLGAMKSLLSGEAFQWRDENIEREKILTSDEADIVLMKHKIHPRILTSYDENGNTNDMWSLIEMEIYYGKNSITIR